MKPYHSYDDDDEDELADPSYGADGWDDADEDFDDEGDDDNEYDEASRTRLGVVDEDVVHSRAARRWAGVVKPSAVCWRSVL
jgi:hypothetical protein